MYEKDYKKEYKLALKKIKEYDDIVIFRHQRPDGDAFGSQLGLAYWIKDSFPTKRVHFVGNNSSSYTPNVFPEMEVIDDEYFDNTKFLAIIVDTGDTKRIDDERYQKADFKIKFDHHPNLEPYGDINIVENEIASCAELIADFIFVVGGKKMPMSKLSAMYLYDGMTTDSGRFMFPSVSPITFKIASKLLEVGIVPAYDCYEKLYEKDVESLVFQKFVLNHMVFAKGVAYYVLTQKDLDELHIDNERGKEHLSLMSNIRGIDIWFCVTEIQEKNEWRVSIRSKKLDISQVARKYRGGGHMQASGATILSLDEMPQLIKDLEDLI